MVSRINWRNLLFGFISTLSLLTFVAAGKLKYFQMELHKTLTFFYHHLSHPPPLFSALYIIFIIFSVFLYFLHPVGKFSNSLPSWNIKRGGILWYGAPKTQIWINPWKSVNRNCHISGKKWTGLTHLYTWYLLRGNPILKLPSSKSLPSIYQYHSLSHI